jgi:hypothetical protein
MQQNRKHAKGDEYFCKALYKQDSEITPLSVNLCDVFNTVGYCIFLQHKHIAESQHVKVEATSHFESKLTMCLVEDYKVPGNIYQGKLSFTE